MGQTQSLNEFTELARSLDFVRATIRHGPPGRLHAGRVLRLYLLAYLPQHALRSDHVIVRHDPLPCEASS